MKERESRWIKLEEVDWRGESKAPQAVWFTDLDEKPQQGQRKVVIEGLRIFWGGSEGTRAGLSKGTFHLKQLPRGDNEKTAWPAVLQRGPNSSSHGQEAWSNCSAGRGALPASPSTCSL